MFHCVLLHLLRVVAPGYPQVIYHTVMVFSGLRHLLHLHLAPTPPPSVVSPTTERARRKEQVFSQLLSELTPFTDMTVVPSIIDLQRRFPGLGKVWATSVHEKLRYARRKSFHEQVADEIIRTVVKRRKGSLLDLDESELADICPDSATLNSRYGGRYPVQDILVRRVMPHRLARLQQEVSGHPFLQVGFSGV